MLIFVCNVIFWVIFVYGFLSLAQDILNEFTYHKINHDMKIFIITKNLGDKLDEFIIEFNLLKKSTVNKNVTLIDLTNKDNLEYINQKLEREEINWKLLDANNGKDLIINQLENND